VAIQAGDDADVIAAEESGATESEGRSICSMAVWSGNKVLFEWDPRQATHRVTLTANCKLQTMRNGNYGEPKSACMPDRLDNM